MVHESSVWDLSLYSRSLNTLTLSLSLPAGFNLRFARQVLSDCDHDIDISSRDTVSSEGLPAAVEQKSYQ